MFVADSATTTLLEQAWGHCGQKVKGVIDFSQPRRLRLDAQRVRSLSPALAGTVYMEPVICGQRQCRSPRPTGLTEWSAKIPNVKIDLAQ